MLANSKHKSAIVAATLAACGDMRDFAGGGDAICFQHGIGGSNEFKFDGDNGT